MANEQNLRPGEYKLSVEEAKKGGINSGKARRHKKMLREIMEEYGSLPDDLDPTISNDISMVIAQYKLAKSEKPGSTQAATFIRDTRGEKPHDVLETPDIEVKPLVDLTKRKKNGK